MSEPLAVFDRLLVEQAKRSQVMLACAVGHFLDYVAENVAPDEHDAWLQTVSDALGEGPRLVTGEVVPNLSMPFLRDALATRPRGHDERKQR